MANVEGEFRIGRRVMATRRDCYMNATVSLSVGQSISLGCVRERWVSFPTSWERCCGPRNCPLPGSQYNQYSTNNPLSCARLIIALRTTLLHYERLIRRPTWLFLALHPPSRDNYTFLSILSSLCSPCSWRVVTLQNYTPIVIICFIDHCYLII